MWRYSVVCTPRGAECDICGTHIGRGGIRLVYGHTFRHAERTVCLRCCDSLTPTEIITRLGLKEREVPHLTDFLCNNDRSSAVRNLKSRRPFVRRHKGQNFLVNVRR